ncbi:MAG: hypothetical protein WC806_05660 [Candidatus Gracilibacteria bacterium]|jgi:hypothetical protein
MLINNMNNFGPLEEKTIKAYALKDKKKREKMHVSGKSVFKLQELIIKKNAGISKRTSSKKNG